MAIVEPVSNKNKYKDPLSKNAALFMSYSNEAGTAIAEIAPKLGTALWAPAFMYLGADIYDKYKNDKDNYNPSTKRAFKQAVYQGVTNLIALPAVILAGQWIVSPIGRIDKSGISANAKDAIYKHTKEVIEQAHGSSLASRELFVNTVKTTLENKINARNNEKKTINIFKKLYNTFFSKRYALNGNNKDKLLAFAQKNSEKTFDILTALKNSDIKKIPKNVYKKYHNILPLMKEMYREEDYAYQASRTALKEFQTSLIFKNKLLKTISGLTALILLVKPVNKFVDKQIMKKYIEPQIDNFSINFVNASKFNIKD